MDEENHPPVRILHVLTYKYLTPLRYDYAATRSHSVIVPACGYDSIPSDVAAWLANKTLKSYAKDKRPGEHFVGIRSSISAQKFRGGVSGGSAASLIAMIESTPRYARREAAVPYSLSPGTFVVHPWCRQLLHEFLNSRWRATTTYEDAL